MLNLGKLGITLALGLTMSLALFTTGAFAQSAGGSNAHVSAHVSTVAGVLQSLNRTNPTTSAQPGWGGDGYGGDGCVICHWYRARIETRTCGGYGGCRWHSTWVQGRTCSGGNGGSHYGGYYGGGYHYGGGGYHYGGGGYHQGGYHYGGYRYGGGGYRHYGNG